MQTVTVMWEGMPVEATVPSSIAGWRPALPEPVVRRTEQAAAAAIRSGTLAAGHLEAAARLLLRADGLASSAIEGLRASAADVAVAETVDDGTISNTTAAWVADNLAVVTEALAIPGPLTEALLFDWHRRLMRNSAAIDPAHVGAYRDRLGWVGGPNPRLAAHIGAPHDLIDDAMADLFAFAARGDIDPITQAAVLHAQFETIHPFADGNGRLGRVLIARTLLQRLSLSVPPPVSLQMARDVGGYQAGLTLYRQDDVDQWVSWFADTVSAAALSAADVLDAVRALQQRWRESLRDIRADSGAHALVEQLPAHPVVSTSSAAGLLGITRRAATNVIAELDHRGMLVAVPTVTRGLGPRGPGRPERWWVADDLLNLLGR